MDKTNAATLTARYSQQNLLIFVGQFIGWMILITAMDRANGWLAPSILLIVFCLMMQGVFSMMHEAFHDLLHPNQTLNNLIGWLSTAIFGSVYTLIRINHLGHHVRNRTKPEIMEYYEENERLEKTATYYFAILGGIWLGSFASIFILPFLSHRLIKAYGLRPNANGYVKSFAEMTGKDWLKLRLEAVATIVLWTIIIEIFAWHWSTLAVAYSAFAFSWSSLQWVYHVRTPLHPIEGAYDLRVHSLVRRLFLNFNYNLSHHRYPTLPWQELHAICKVEETQQLSRRYLQIFLPPQPMPQEPSTIKKVYC